MARLGGLAEGTPVALELLRPGSCWQLSAPLDLTSHWAGPGLATQAAAGRCLEVLEPWQPGRSRLRVRLLEDGYPGWLDPQQLLGGARACQPPRPRLLDSVSIAARLPAVLAFVERAQQQPNHYLWGGTVGPDFDCSGLIQAAFASVGVWLPRDAYQQERFCQPVAVAPGCYSLLQPGDLLFFGRPQRCTHVGLHLGGGRYLHSSGREHGRNGIGLDALHPHLNDPVSAHYRGELRGAGRVVRCHNGITLP